MYCLRLLLIAYVVSIIGHKDVHKTGAEFSLPLANFQIAFYKILDDVKSWKGGGGGLTAHSLEIFNEGA